MENYMARAKIEREEQWDEYQNLPRLKFPPDWEVQMVPPFGGALARFWVFKGENRVSVYFDAHSKLGSVGSPYWEIYPAVDGDVDRFLQNETDAMLLAIEASLNSPKASR